MDNRSTTQPTAGNAITSDMSSMGLKKAPEVSTEKLAGEKSPPTDMPCIIIKNIYASEQAQVNVSAAVKDSFNKTQSQLSQAQPVFSDLLQCLQIQLTAHYTETSFVNKRLFDTDYFSLADYFVNLQVVVTADKTNEVTQNNDDKHSHKPLRERDRLTGKKEAIAQGDLLQPSAYQDANGKSPASIDTVVVSGAAGVGKTTLMDYIAYQWALFKQGAGKEGLWSDFETVLIVRCRDLQPKALGLGKKTKSIAELLHCACWGQLDICLDEAKQLLSTLKSAPKSCLLLLDGLDELPVPKKTYWRNLLLQLFQLPFKKLVTTRPYAISNLQQWLSHDGLVEIQGFSDEDVLTFFKKHLGVTERTNNFIKDIKRNPDLWAIVHIPINAYLLKIWWKTTCQKDKPVLLSEMSVSDLYESLMVNVCRRYLAKIGELDENKLLDDEMVLEVPSIRCLLDTLGCWAFEGLRQDTAQLPISWLKGVQGGYESPTLLSENRLKQLNMPALKALGLLKQVGHAIRAQQMYEFLHLSFQEFLAANVIAVTLTQGAKEQKTHLTQIIHRYKYHPNFTLVWPSVAGLLSRYPTVLNDFLSILVTGPKDWLGILEFNLLMRCLVSSLPSNIDTNALGLRQQTLLRAVKQRIKQFNELPKKWQLTTIDTLSMCPRLIYLNADTVWALLRDEKVSDYVRGKLAKSAVAYLSPTPELVDAVLAFLSSETVRSYFRVDLARSALVHLSQTPECVEAVLAFLWDETVMDSVRVELAKSAFARLPQTPELVDSLWALLRDEAVSDHVRCPLASSVVAHLSPTPEFVEAVWAFLRNEQVDRDVRVELAISAIAYLSQTPELVDSVWAFLRDKAVSDSVRSALVISAVSHLSPTPEFVDAVWTFLRDETVSDSVRVSLAINTITHLSLTSELVGEVLAFLWDETVDDCVRVALARSAVSRLSQVPKFMDVVLALLRDETVEGSLRGDLARNAVSHLLPTPEFVDVVWVLLRDETVSNDFRVKLAKSAVAHLPQTAEFVDAVLAFLWDEAVMGSVRCNLAISAIVHLPPTPELVDAVLLFLWDEAVEGPIRSFLAISAIVHLSPTPELVDAVLAFLRDEAVEGSVRVDLAISAVSHLSPTRELVDAAWALLRDETISDSVRVDLARSTVSHLSPTSEFVHAILALLRDEAVDNCVRGFLASSAIVHLSPTPEFVDAVLAFLRDEVVESSVRVALVRRAVLYLPLTPELMDAVLVFLRDEMVSDSVRVALVRIAIQQLPKWPYKAQAFLDSLFVKDSVGGDLSQHVDIPVHLLLPLYKEAHNKGRQYIREQLVKHGVLVYEQTGTVVVVQAGQTEQLTLSQSIIQQVKRDLQTYRVDINNSASILSKLGLFSKSVMSFFSSQHTEKRSGQTSCSNMGRVMQ